MKTPIRRLKGVSYWVIEDLEGIYDLINTELRREWEEDARNEGRGPKEDSWLKTLPKFTWSLETTETDHIKLDPRIMNHVIVKNGYARKPSQSEPGTKRDY